MDESNPYLHLAIMEVIENQLEADEPLETGKTLKRLIDQGISEKDAKLCIGQAVCIEIFNIMKNKEEFNMERYIKNLHRLPEEPKE